MLALFPADHLPKEAYLDQDAFPNCANEGGSMWVTGTFLFFREIWAMLFGEENKKISVCSQEKAWQPISVTWF